MILINIFKKKNSPHHECFADHLIGDMLKQHLRQCPPPCTKEQAHPPPFIAPAQRCPAVKPPPRLFREERCQWFGRRPRDHHQRSISSSLDGGECWLKTHRLDAVSKGRLGCHTTKLVVGRFVILHVAKESNLSYYQWTSSWTFGKLHTSPTG